MYELLLAIHLLAAVTWVGGSIAMTLMGARMTAAQRREITPQFSWYGEKVIPGSAAILLIAGILLVNELESVEITDLWILLAIAGWLVSAAFGVGVFGPAGKQVQAAIAAGDTATADKAYERIMTFSKIDTLLVVLVLIDMAVKPGG